MPVDTWLKMSCKFGFWRLRLYFCQLFFGELITDVGDFTQVLWTQIRRVQIELAPVPVLVACVSMLVQPDRAEPNQCAAYLFGNVLGSMIRGSRGH